MEFTPVGHISGIHQTKVDVTAKMPWLYIIAAMGSKVLYIGETFEQGGLIGRVSSHFGTYLESTFKQRAEKVVGVRHLRGPYLTVAARLPFEEENETFNGGAKKVRLAAESILHTQVGLKFLVKHREWNIISSTQGFTVNIPELETACSSIYHCFESTYSFLATISQAVPFQMILLDFQAAKPQEEKQSVGELIEDIEITLFSWMMERIQNENENWWGDAIPENIRIQCVTRKEQEKSILPPEAYFTMIDLRDIAKKNWLLFSSSFEKISGLSGKDKATTWMIELNEMRKYWAHPIKRIHSDIEPSKISALYRLAEQIKQAINEDKLLK